MKTIKILVIALVASALLSSCKRTAENRLSGEYCSFCTSQVSFEYDANGDLSSVDIETKDCDLDYGSECMEFTDDNTVIINGGNEYPVEFISEQDFIDDYNPSTQQLQIIDDMSIDEFMIINSDNQIVVGLSNVSKNKFDVHFGITEMEIHYYEK